MYPARAVREGTKDRFGDDQLDHGWYRAAMATVAPAAEAATSALKVITEMVRTVRLILFIS